MAFPNDLVIQNHHSPYRNFFMSEGFFSFPEGLLHPMGMGICIQERETF